MAEEICRRLRMSKKDTERISFLVAQHLRHCSAADMRRSTLKKFLRQEGIEELLELTRIDALGSNGDLSRYDFFARSLRELSEASEHLRPPPLVSGHDLIAMGLSPGPRFRELLGEVEEAQLDGRLSSRDASARMGSRALLRERMSGPKTAARTGRVGPAAAVHLRGDAQMAER